MTNNIPQFKIVNEDCESIIDEYINQQSNDGNSDWNSNSDTSSENNDDRKDDGNDGFEVFDIQLTEDEAELDVDEIKTTNGKTIYYDPSTTYVYHQNTIDGEYNFIGRMVEINPETAKYAVKYCGKLYMITYPYGDYGNHQFCIITEQVFNNEKLAKLVC
jgi:hypothetical protein